MSNQEKRTLRGFTALDLTTMDAMTFWHGYINAVKLLRTQMEKDGSELSALTAQSIVMATQLDDTTHSTDHTAASMSTAETGTAGDF
jgi:hypothetical protein